MPASGAVYAAPFFVVDIFAMAYYNKILRKGENGNTGVIVLWIYKTMKDKSAP